MHCAAVGSSHFHSQLCFLPQAMRHTVATIATQIEAARLLVYNAARLKDLGLPHVKEGAMAKWFAGEVSRRACGTLDGGDVRGKCCAVHCRSLPLLHPSASRWRVAWASHVTSLWRSTTGTARLEPSTRGPLTSNSTPSQTLCTKRTSCAACSLLHLWDLGQV